MNHLIQPLEARRLMSVTPFLLPHVVSLPFSEFAGVPQVVTVGFLPLIQVEHLSQLKSTINWGDGTSSPAQFDRTKTGIIDIYATHTYVKPGTFSVTSGPINETVPNTLPVEIDNIGQIATTATVTPTPVQLTETAGKTFTAVMGKFNQFTLDTYFTAVINWGDGVTSTATLSGGDLNQGNWEVTGTHYYQHAGTYQAHAYVYSHLAPNGKGYLAMDLFTLVHVVS